MLKKYLSKINIGIINMEIHRKTIIKCAVYKELKICLGKVLKRCEIKTEEKSVQIRSQSNERYKDKVCPELSNVTLI